MQSDVATAKVSGAKREREDDQTMVDNKVVPQETAPPASSEVTIRDLMKKMADFAKERDWDKFHSPRNLLLAMVGEVGELSEIFQWKGEVGRGLPGWEEAEKLHLGEELSDVLLYLVRLSDICGVDLGKAALRKMELNAVKYPVNSCRGSSEKQNAIIDDEKEEADDDKPCGAGGGAA